MLFESERRPHAQLYGDSLGLVPLQPAVVLDRAVVN